MSTETWNKLYPVGSPVAAYPGTRDDAPLITRTRSRAWTLGHDTPVVMVDGCAGGIALDHVDPIEGPGPVAERQLTRHNIRRIETLLDRAGVYAKDYTQTVNGLLMTVGLRIGEKPGHVVARFGDTIIWHADGTHTVRTAGERGGSGE